MRMEMTVRKRAAHKHVIEKLAGTDYVLRPFYDEVVAELGVPPPGYPKNANSIGLTCLWLLGLNHLLAVTFTSENPPN